MDETTEADGMTPIDELRAWLPTIILLLLVITAFIGRTWLQKRIERSVQHTFDEKLEKIRSDFRDTEERLKSDLRTRESELSALRDGVLSGRAQRQALLDKRRLDAVDRVWTTMMDLAPYRAIASMMERINLEYVAKEAPRNEAVRKFVATFTDNTFKLNNDNVSKYERPFVAPGVWAYFSVYQTVLLTIFAQAKALEFGMENSSEMIRINDVKDMLKTALPHRSNIIDNRNLFGLSVFADELEECVLREMSKMLDGQDVDQTSFAHVTEIIRAANSARDHLATTPGKASDDAYGENDKK